MISLRSRSLLLSFMLLSFALLGAACAKPQAPEVHAPEQAQTPEPAVTPAQPVDHGEFTLEERDGATSPRSWSEPEGHVFCRWYAEPERGDYVWIRLAQTPEQDGDAGPRLDIDLCRLSQRPSGTYTPTSAGAHGSHCAPEPGFSIWWHAGEQAYNNGPQTDEPRPGCALEVEFDADTMTLTGEFACPDLAAAAHAQHAPTNEPERDASGLVQVTAGKFSCHVDRVPTS